MQVTYSPNPNSPAFRDIVYKISATPNEVIDVNIYDHANATLIGKKRFTGFASYTLNVAAYAKQQIVVAPLSSTTSRFLVPAKRYVKVNMLINAQKHDLQVCGGQKEAIYFIDLTTGPPQRTISPVHWDEIAFQTDTSASVQAVLTNDETGISQTLTLAAPNTTVTQTYHFFLSMFDIEKKIKTACGLPLTDFNRMNLLINIGEDLTLERAYTIVPVQKNHMRICWWNAYGQIDYYTFERVERKEFTVEKRKIETNNGRKTIACKGEHITTIVSGVLTNRNLEWLSEIIASPQVWVQNAKAHVPIEVISTHTVTKSDQLARLELQIVYPNNPSYYNF